MPAETVRQHVALAKLCHKSIQELHSCRIILRLHYACAVSVRSYCFGGDINRNSFNAATKYSDTSYKHRQ